jgi:hypothetical protein
VLVVGKSLVIIEISALRASALAIFSAKWFKLEVLRDAKLDSGPLNTSKQLKREALDGFKLSVFSEYVKPPENRKVW